MLEEAYCWETVEPRLRDVRNHIHEAIHGFRGMTGQYVMKSVMLLLRMLPEVLNHDSEISVQFVRTLLQAVFDETRIAVVLSDVEAELLFAMACRVDDRGVEEVLQKLFDRG